MDKIETNTVKPQLSITNEGVEHLILNLQEESLLDSKIADVENYMSSNVGKDKTDEEKDELYKEAQVLWYNFVNSLKDAKYNFFLNRAEHKFLTDLILTKLEYDVNTIFFAIELTNTMGGMKDAKYVNDKDVVAFPVNATEITYIYHLISKHKIKGLTKDAYTFSKLLLKIGDISKIFNYYEATSKNLSKDIQDWIVTFDSGVDFETASGSVLQPEA
jgi:hypothetical protein